MKKIISLVLVFCMLFSLGVSAFAEEAGGDTGGGSVPAAPASGGDTGGGDTGGGDTGGGSVPDAPASGGESGGGSVPDAPASGGDTGGGSAPAAAPVMLASSAPALASPPGATGGGTVTETVGNVYAGNEGKSVTVGGVTVSFDASGQGENISQVTKDESGAIHIDANVDGSDEAVKVEGNTTVNITGQVDSDDYGIEAKGGSNVTADSVSAISGYGVEAGGGSTVNVVNNVSTETGVGVNAGGRDATVNVGGDVGNATVNVGGDVTSQNSRGVHAANNKVVSVTRNVSGSDYGVYAISGNVTVGGTVTATDGTGVFAQEESTSLSKNIKWTVQKKYAQGKVHGHHDTFGYKWVGEELVIEPEQAKIVQLVFDSYIGGMTYGQITKELNRKGIKSLTGKSFPMASVVRMLKNEQYTGCLILQQAYNYEPNKSKLNRGEMPMYRIDGHHPAIISEETFALAQKIREQRGEAAVVPSSLKSVFSGRVWCGKCGGKAACHRSAESRRDGNANRTYWICNSRNNKRGCDCAIYKDKQLHEAAETLGIQPDQIERFTLFDTRIVITQTNGRTATWKQA